MLKIIEYLISNSNLLGPRANLELADAFAELVEDYSAKDPERLWSLCQKLIKNFSDEASSMKKLIKRNGTFDGV